MELPERTTLDIFTDIPLPKNQAVSALVRLVDGVRDVRAPSIILSGWPEISEMYVDDNDNRKPRKLNTNFVEDNNFQNYRYIVELEPATTLTDTKFQKAADRLRGLLEANGWPAQVVR